METEIEVLKGRLSILETRMSLVEERPRPKSVEIVFEADAEPIEVFVTDENLAMLRRAVDRL